MSVEDGLIRTHGGMGLLYWTGGKLRGLRDSRGLQDARPRRQFRCLHSHSHERREEWMPVTMATIQIDNEPEKSNKTTTL